MKKKFWTSEKIVSFSAIFISVMSLFIFKKQTDIIEEQSHRSVMPYLLMETSNSEKFKTFGIDIKNHGVGPAIIEERKIYFHGEVYDMEFRDFFWNVLEGTDSINVINNSSLQPGFALPAGASRNIMVAGGDDYSYMEFLRVMEIVMGENFQYKIVYRSIYNDRWEISSENNTPELLDD